MRRRTTHRRRGILRDLRAFSSVVGTIFMVLVVLLFSTSVFLWTLAQNTSYNETVKQQSQEEINRRNENIFVTKGNYSASEDMVKVEAILTNAGPVTAAIVNLWVFDTSKQTYGFNNSFAITSQAILNPGQALNLIGEQAVNVNVPEARPLDTFGIYFVTARGNTVPVPQPENQTIIVAQVAQGIGAIGMDFKTFRYYLPSGNTIGPSYSSFSFPGGASTILGIYLTNWDELGRTINLTRYCCVWLYVPASSTVASWQITKVVNGTIQPFDYQLLEYGSSTLVYFGPTTANNLKNSIAAVNLLLFGKIGSQDYGQNLPFIAVYVTN